MHKKKFNLKNLFWIIPTAIILIIGSIYLFNKNKIDNEVDWMTMKQEQKLDVPLENQMPDLPNGCEVTSLSMLMNYYGIKVNKNELAENIQHVDFFTDGGKYRGNPNQALSVICRSPTPAGAFITARFITLRVNILRTSKTSQEAIF